METLYQKLTVIGRVKNYFAPYLELLTKPSGNKLFLLLLSLLTIQYATSVNHLFRRFLGNSSLLFEEHPTNMNITVATKIMILGIEYMQIPPVACDNYWLRLLGVRNECSAPTG